MLEMFKDLTVSGDAATVRELPDAISNVGGWARASEVEENANRGLGTARERTFVFAWAGPNPPSALLFLVLEKGTLRVSNIVPREPGELSRAEYNQILDDFAGRALGPVASAKNLTISITASQRDISEFLSAEATSKLKAFSSLANKGTGAGHPHDKRRWLAFLIQVHDDDSDLDTGTLERWLIEEERWPESVANDLVISFENSLELLKAYDASR